MTTFHGSTVVQPVPLSRRKYVANFLGRAQGKVGRLQLVELAKQYPDKLEAPELKLKGPNKLGRTDKGFSLLSLEAPELKLKGPNKLGRTEYFDHLRSAKFCLAPRGESSWTLRFYESYFEVYELRNGVMHQKVAIANSMGATKKCEVDPTACRNILTSQNKSGDRAEFDN